MWGAFGVSVAVSFFLAPFIVHRLGNTAYGVWVLLASLVGYMGLLDLGIRSAVTRYVARFHALGEDGDASRIVSAGLGLFTLLGLAAVLIAAVLAVLVDRIFNIPASLVGTARYVFVVGGVTVGASLVFGVFGGVVAAMQRFDINSGLEVAVGLLRAALVVIALLAGQGLAGLATIQLACTIVGGVGSWWVARRVYPQLRGTFAGWHRAYVRQIFSFSAYLSILHWSGSLIFEADSLVIGAFLPVGRITFFAIAASLTNYARNVISGISQTAAPRASAMDAGGSHEDLRDVVLRLGRVATLVILPITITFLLRGATFIRLWMGTEYAAPSGQVLWILSVALSFAAARQVAMSTIVGINQHRILVPFYVAEALINLGLSVYLIGFLGLAGVAWGTAAPNLVTSLLVIPWALRRALGVPLGRLYVQFWLRPLAAMAPFAVASAWVESQWPARGLVVYFLQVAAMLPIAGLGAWIVGSPASERSLFGAELRRRWQSLVGKGGDLPTAAP